MRDADAAAAAIAAQTEGEAAPVAEAATDDTATAEDVPAADPATADDATTADTATPPAEDGSTVADDTSAETATPPAADVDVNVETEATAEATVEGEAPSAEDQADRTAELEAERQNAAAAAAAAALAAGTAVDGDAPEVVTEDVTEDDVRTADEDFVNRIGDIREADSNDDDGLSNFEKALVLGLGAVVVGSLLRNGDEVVSNSGDRVIVERDGQLRVLKNDDVLLRQPGAQVGTQTFDDGSTLTTVTRDDGSVVTTIRSADGTVLRRSLTQVDGTQVALIDDLGTASVPVVVSDLPPVPTERVSSRSVALNDQAALETALTASLLANTGRTYSLEQVRGIREVRALAPQIDLDAITFETGSAAIQPSQAEQLAALGGAIRQIVANNPSAIFLVEGHTDAVGDAGYNLGLSDRRAETVALALSQYFSVPPENLVTQGYGEQFLRVQSLGDERANRRASVRNITQLLRS
ncbi:Outer membrane protein OmpA and related peptidoglycan-associated (lipo)proteins [Loktanella fryxellensis]|uniref:Outer membrane protein OmpA and related peptidoglycan-associated (Lipo)proteins n=1 Tax=Loktanella fryxellensis TaxID=245187 RepID=A0A1H8JHV6_9RHOB|nr:OmpA family protein [Loktanella fryxellensis]SEN80393.1 Outer membrane protein OmpA and related peptidoglycan-associated (lipo)proteins [Loktanella fryxellensis]